MSAICRFLTASSADGAMAFSAGLSGQGPAMAQGVVTRDTRSGTLQFEANGYPTPSTAYGTDGSIGIFLQAEEPTDPTERANWLPAREGPFYLVTRHYSPQAAILTGDWLPSAIVAR